MMSEYAIRRLLVRNRHHVEPLTTACVLWVCCSRYKSLNCRHLLKNAVRYCIGCIVMFWRVGTYSSEHQRNNAMIRKLNDTRSDVGADLSKDLGNNLRVIHTVL